MPNKKWSSQAKLEIILKALKSDMTMSDLCQLYQVAPSHVYAWMVDITYLRIHLNEYSDVAKM